MTVPHARRQVPPWLGRMMEGHRGRPRPCAVPQLDCVLGGCSYCKGNTPAKQGAAACHAFLHRFLKNLVGCTHGGCVGVHNTCRRSLTALLLHDALQNSLQTAVCDGG